MIIGKRVPERKQYGQHYEYKSKNYRRRHHEIAGNTLLKVVFYVGSLCLDNVFNYKRDEHKRKYRKYDQCDSRHIVPLISDCGLSCLANSLCAP